MNITPHVSINGGVSYEKQAGSIKNSPLTENKSYQPVVNIGMTYWF
jgi:outer membrane scaffolding protein for murein synthesis (MipA/OmpV family)